MKHLNMENEIEYQFWFWSHKLTGVISMLAILSKYELDKIELEAINHHLIGTNDELNQWTKYQLEGKKYNMGLKLAYDSEEKSDMIHIKIKTASVLMEKLEALNLFQCMFKKLDLEN